MKKKVISLVLVLALCFAMVFSIVACNGGNQGNGGNGSGENINSGNNIGSGAISSGDASGEDDPNAGDDNNSDDEELTPIQKFIYVVTTALSSSIYNGQDQLSVMALANETQDASSLSSFPQDIFDSIVMEGNLFPQEVIENYQTVVRDSIRLSAEVLESAWILAETLQYEYGVEDFYGVPVVCYDVQDSVEVVYTFKSYDNHIVICCRSSEGDFPDTDVFYCWDVEFIDKDTLLVHGTGGYVPHNNQGFNSASNYYTVFEYLCADSFGRGVGVSRFALMVTKHTALYETILRELKSRSTNICIS